MCVYLCVFTSICLIGLGSFEVLEIQSMIFDMLAIILPLRYLLYILYMQ